VHSAEDAADLFEWRCGGICPLLVMVAVVPWFFTVLVKTPLA